METRAYRKTGYTTGQKLIISIILLAALILIFVIIFGDTSLFKSTPPSSTTKSVSQAPASEPSRTNPYALLEPATVAPKVAECSQSLSYSSAGAPGPIQCSNGDLNILAWAALAAQEPKVMALGYSPSQSGVQAAFCSDVNAAASDSAPGADNAIEETVFDISSLYYGWNFTTTASQFASTCG